jgi:hypothetical protein
MTEWTTADSAAALAEGWDLFYTSGDEPYELQRYDETFPDDPSAWKHVIERAAEGSELHQRALAVLAEHSPLEYKVVTTWKAISPDRLDIVWIDPDDSDNVFAALGYPRRVAGLYLVQIDGVYDWWFTSLEGAVVHASGLAGQPLDAVSAPTYAGEAHWTLRPEGAWG